MKSREILFICLLIIYQNAQAQQDTFRVNFGFQYSLPERLFNSNLSRFETKNQGPGLHLHPKYFIRNKQSVGLNIEYNYISEAAISDDIGYFGLFSLVPMFSQYFGSFKIKPFVAGGIGYYEVYYHSIAEGVGARIGTGINFFNVFEFSMELNRLLFDVKVDPRITSSFDSYYIALKGSFSIGLGN